ncbi:hypothetical protein [Streptomyces spiramenti]|uniref:Uncharacterized protein n=1 Tax=Streptomyces spiramenti TaxID=2720606 RepID=A0ABX1AKM2_9ACTN|nr:hypothetical protein [Streptomyces spiramenti]NJP66556.1 hypothetical protein [Streptomyces spiramenti]
MHDSSDSGESAAAGEGGLSKAAASAAVVESPPRSAVPGSETEPLTLIEVHPGVALLTGDVPPEFADGRLDFDFGLVPEADRRSISAVLASIGHTATVGGDIRSAAGAAHGLYRIGDPTRALLADGGKLVVKDGANLGTVVGPGGTLHQARFYPVGLSKAQAAASIGPALAMVALQMMLSEVSSLVRTNLTMTNQVLSAVRKEQWAELTGLVATIDAKVDHAREIGSVPQSLWEGVAANEPLLQKQLQLYPENVRDHLAHLGGSDTRSHREYLRERAADIAFDAHALLSLLKARAGYQALRAAKARAAGRDDADEAKYAEVVARDARAEFDTMLSEATSLIRALTRHLRITAELPGSDGWPLAGKRKDAKAARETSARLLEAIEPLSDALRPPAPALEAPEVVCAPESLALDPYLRILRWFLDDTETLRALAFPEQLDALGPLSAIVGGAKEKLAAARDKAAVRTLVAVTDRRVITARSNAFLEQAEVRQEIPLDQVRYVRAAADQAAGRQPAIDLITRDDNLRWLFPAGADAADVGAFAAELAESMTIPDSERQELRDRRRTSIEAGTRAEIGGPTSKGADSAVTPPEIE